MPSRTAARQVPDEPEPEFRYVRPKRWMMNELPMGDHGIKDDRGYEWVRGANHHFRDIINPNTGLPFEKEWDVQLPNGKHWNIDPRLEPEELP
jgi:hypothetical protein